jgi:hypothetical protein
MHQPEAVRPDAQQAELLLLNRNNQKFGAAVAGSATAGRFGYGTRSQISVSSNSSPASEWKGG